MREIIFDTETTGLDPQSGDRLVEIGCIEMVNRVTTGETFHCYFNPERDMPAAAENVHGLSITFLSDKPKFVERVHDLLDHGLVVAGRRYGLVRHQSGRERHYRSGHAA